MKLPKLEFDAPVEPLVDRLQLADWRRRVAELYAQVRGEPDVERAHAHWRQRREWLYREHPASPVAAADRASFRAQHFAYDPALRFEVKLEPEPAAEADAAGLELPVSTGNARRFDRAGRLEVPLRTGTRRLALFWLSEYSGGLFLAFRDATNGRETYGGGRYLLDTAKGADLGGDAAAGIVVVDFNFAFQPSCAFDPRWSCPLAAPENRLDAAIRAGERIA
jgi:uncharacterized protein (DUF1684 family)